MDSNQSHGPGPQKIPSPNVRSPLSPGSGSSGTPISFQPNVNRSKTKRWVEARQYSYDGGDWGDEDDEEEEEEEEAPPPVPRPPYAHNNSSSSGLGSRRLSGLDFGSDESASTARKPSGGDQKPLPFVRPADLYKRMREEKATQSPIAGNDSTSDSFGASPQPTQPASSVGLPEVKRISSFGTDLFGGAEPNPPANTNPETQEPALQHNPSSGYRSVVNQAFDVPQTPQSTTTSVERSNSDGTSVISPIMGSRNINDDRTPTILEEPNETSPPRETRSETPVFHPGHRRDLSLPSSNNSPSRRPHVTDQEPPTADRAEISDISSPLHGLPEANLGMHSSSTMQPYSNNGNDLPAPLKVGTASGPDSFLGEIPTIMGAQESPQNADNDRLREEIIRSLSREATPSEDPEQSSPPQSQAPAQSIPNQFEKYWEGQTGPSLTQDRNGLVSDNHPDWTGPHPLAPKDPYANSQANSSSTVVDQPKKAKLERRFSWESSDAEEPGVQIPGSYSSPPQAAPLSMQEPEPIADVAPVESNAPREPFASDNEDSDTQRVEKPRLSIIPPVPENISPPQQVMGPDTTLPQQAQAPSITKNSSLDESQLLGFRDIIGITSISQRIKSFEHTRDQFATLDTGLNQWLQFMVHEHSEHTDVVEQSKTLSPVMPQSSPSRSRFPKLPSLANLGSSNDGTPTSASHVRRPSGHIGSVMNRQNVGDKGKEFLHTAGAFSGKASGAAKGLFAKGRSKFRPSGGSDKGQSAPSAPRRSFQFSFPSGSGDVSGNSTLRNSVTFGSLPLFKSGRTGGSAPDVDPIVNSSLDGSQDEDNSHKRARVANSGDKSMMSHKVDESAVQPKHLSANGVRPKTGNSDRSEFAEDFEQEMNAALGLSPTESQPQRSASTPMALNPSQMNGAGKRPMESPRPQEYKVTGVRSVSDMPTKKAPIADKGLPIISTEPFDVPSWGINSKGNPPSKSTPEIIVPSIRQVFDESSKPRSPPPKNIDNRLSRDGHHTLRQPSISTLGPDEETGRRKSEDDGFDRVPPSPLQPPQSDIEPESEPQTKVDRPVNGKSTPNANFEPPTQDVDQSFVPFYPSEPTTSAEILEAKRKSISGLPPSLPGVQSPLRNEVRYSPGTRSSMLSFGSFGRQSKGTRPVTPASGLSQVSQPGSPAGNEESTFGKLKNFGRRRRASVGDLLSGIQLQGAQSTSGGQRKRTFSRLSGLFGRQDSQNAEGKSSRHARTTSEPLQVKDLPAPPLANENLDTARPVDDQPPVLSDPFEQKPLPIEPWEPAAAPAPPHSETPQRASLSLPPSSSNTSMLTGRFYSQLQSGALSETPVGSRHTGALSHPDPEISRSPSPMSVHETRLPQPLSPLGELQDCQAHQLENEQAKPELQHGDSMDPNNLGPLNENQEQEEQEVHKDRVLEEHLRHELHGDPSPAAPSQQPDLQVHQPEQSLSPQLSVRSRKPVGSSSVSPAFETRVVSTASVLSSHPHRSEDETRVVNDIPEPVELAITADDSSEEIVMSPTAYPGQEWTPMHL